MHNRLSGLCIRLRAYTVSLVDCAYISELAQSIKWIVHTLLSLVDCAEDFSFLFSFNLFREFSHFSDSCARLRNELIGLCIDLLACTSDCELCKLRNVCKIH